MSATKCRTPPFQPSSHDTGRNRDTGAGRVGQRHASLSGARPCSASKSLQLAFNSVLKLKKTLVHTEDPNEPGQEGFEQQVDTMLAVLGSELEESQSLAFSSMPIKDRKITLTGIIGLKLNLEERVAATASIGQDELWSSANLHRQLHFLESTTPRTEASVRVWIQAFFFRASAMLPPNKRVVLNMEHRDVVPGSTLRPSSLSTLSGPVDYTAVVAITPVLKTYMQFGFFVIEAKIFNPADHIPEAAREMYACGKLLQKKVLRGALTNGREWIFLLMNLNDDGGAFYKRSKTVLFREIPGPWPDLIAGILSHWIENSFVDLGGDDWFEQA